MSDLPASVQLREVGPREGLQLERGPIDTAAKVRIVDSLAETGLTEIEFVSFVNPERVPSMADAEEVVAGIRPRPGVRYEGIWLNLQGLDRAAKLRDRLTLRPTLGVPTSETFSQKNTNRTLAQHLEDVPAYAERYRQLGVDYFELLIPTAFGCNYEGDISAQRVLDVIGQGLARAAEAGMRVPVVELLDTMGWANPLQVKRLVGAIRERWPDNEVSLHLHDTRGTGIANVMAALEVGVRTFDSAIGGWGGWPFAEHKGAAGNVASEDVAFLCQEIGVDTGVDLSALIEVARLVEATIGRPLPGKVKTGGNLATYRARTGAA
ncbi:MAG TPA: hydroxymethylglutaryl-CoA lyase [Chloroflexota bacterium]